MAKLNFLGCQTNCVSQCENTEYVPVQRYFLVQKYILVSSDILDDFLSFMGGGGGGDVQVRFSDGLPVL